MEYGTADGGTIKNLGERCVVFDTEDGQTAGMRLQVGDKITKPLGAISRIVDKGNRVVFESGYGYIENDKSGERTYMEEKEGLYMVKLWVPRDQEGFTRR